MYLLPFSFGAGMLLSAQFIGLTACSPKEQLASFIGIYNLFQQIGAIVGTSLGSTGTRILFQRRLWTDLPGFEGKQMVIEKIIRNFSFSTTLPGAMQAIVHSSYLQAFRSVPCEWTRLSTSIPNVDRLTMTQSRRSAGVFWLYRFLFSIAKGGWHRCVARCVLSAKKKKKKETPGVVVVTGRLDNI